MTPVIEEQATKKAIDPILLSPEYEWLEVLWKHRCLIAKCSGVGLLIATLTAFLIPRQYESVARLMPPDPPSSATAMMTAAMGGANEPPAVSGLASNLLGTKSQGAIFVGVLQSRTVLDSLVNRFDLRKEYRCSRYIEARTILTERTSVAEEKKSGIISIAVRDEDPNRARDLANAYVEELNRAISQLSMSSGRRERIFLEERIRLAQNELDSASLNLSQFSSRTGTIDMQDQPKTMLEAAAKLQSELIAAQSELRELKAAYAEDNVRVRGLRARIDELQIELHRISGNDPLTDGKEGNDQLYPSIRKAPPLFAIFADRYRRVKTQEAVLDILTRQYELAKVEEAKELPSVKVLDQPVLAEKQSFPPRLSIILGGMLLGMLASGSFVLGENRWREIHPLDPRKVLIRKLFGTQIQR
jgi:capsule polysaccharide export protein KpsE/RkpR